jgi:uncharacterized protein (TIGR02271 family)
VRARKKVDTFTVREEWPRDRDDVELERVPAAEGDSGEVETLADGTISIPVYEEELVVTKRTVLKERVLVRKRTVAERVTIEDELRRERVEVEADDGVGLVDEREPPP